MSRAPRIDVVPLAHEPALPADPYRCVPRRCPWDQWVDGWHDGEAVSVALTQLGGGFNGQGYEVRWNEDGSFFARPCGRTVKGLP